MSESLRRFLARSFALALMLALPCVPAGALEYSLDDELFRAAGWGEVAKVEALLKSGANVNYELRPGTSVLVEAISKGHVAVVQALLAAKADVNPGAKGRTSPLYVAASANRWEIVPILLAAKANPNIQDSAGETPLYFAATSGRQDIVKALLAAGADPSPRVKFGGGRSALVSVLMSSNLDMASLLLKAGADGNDATDYQETPLRLVSGGNTPRHLELVRSLLAAGVNVEAGQIPRQKLENPCGASNRGQNCVGDLRTAEGTALGIAAGSGSVEIIQALLAAKALVNARQPGWRTPLMIAATDNSADVVLRGGVLVRGGRADVVRMLLAAGADVNAKDGSGKTALMLAEERGNEEVARILRNASTATAGR